MSSGALAFWQCYYKTRKSFPVSGREQIFPHTFHNMSVNLCFIPKTELKDFVFVREHLPALAELKFPSFCSPWDRREKLDFSLSNKHCLKTKREIHKGTQCAVIMESPSSGCGVEPPDLPEAGTRSNRWYVKYRSAWVQIPSQGPDSMST